MPHRPRGEAPREEIAIIGRSCRLPGAPTVADLWTLLSEGRCAVTSIPEDRWPLAPLWHPRLAERGKAYTWAAGVLDDIWSFDPGAFAISPREAEQMDPQQRLLLELTWEAFEDAGLRPSALAGSETGVFVGASAVDHSNLRMLDMCSADAYMMTGNTLSVVSNRLSYAFDLHGPSFTIDTACSSSLVAVGEAVANLRSGRIETALVGGVSILAAPQSFIGFSQAAMLSRRGLCQAFSAHADGYVRAEGGVVLVLKTRKAAERDGDHIRGFILDAQTNSDGRTNGISLPSKTYQSKLLERLYRDNGIDPSALAFIEAHGTGTPVGDPIEASAIGETLGRRRGEKLPIGSIKTNIGHMEAASGLGGLLKALLALEHGALPASLHSEELNPNIDFDALNLTVAQATTNLAARGAHRRLAGVNSFGFGGTNAHAILAEGPRKQVEPPPDAPSYLVVSAHSRAALTTLASNYAARLEPADQEGANALVASANHHRDRLAHRIVVPLGPGIAMAEALDGLREEEREVVGAARGTAVKPDAPVAFVFSGNGSQYAGMGLVAYARSAAFKAKIDELSEMFAEIAGWSIVGLLRSEDLAAKLESTQYAQPLLFAIQSAASHTLRRLGLEPSVVLGHSVGEVAAAEAAGILDTASALRTIHARSLHQELARGRGTMAVVIGSLEATQAMLAKLPSLEIAAYNSPRAFTVSGSVNDIGRLSDLAREHKARVRKLDLLYPFHSALMEPVEAPLLASLKGLARGKPTCTFISTVTGLPAAAPGLDGHYWWRNVREPVRFAQAVEKAAAAGARVFVEIGPTPTLLSHITDTLGEGSGPVATIAAMDKRDKGVDPLSMTVASAIARGAKVDEGRTFGSKPTSAVPIDLPLYPWQRKAYRLPASAEATAVGRPGSWHPLIGSRIHPDRLEWRSTLDTALHPSLADHCVEGRAILPGAAFAEMALAVARDWLDSAQVTVTDVEITSPMQLTAETSREVCCRLSPIASHIEILSRPRLSASPWQTHVTAKIVRDPTVGTLPELDDHRHATASHAGNSHVVTGAEIYAMANRAGLQYGPSFQKLVKAIAIRPDCILLDLTDESADPVYGLDPARFDSCFHALVLVFSSLREAVHGTAYVPVRFGEIALLKPASTFSKARIDVLRRDERIIIANFLLTDTGGEVVAFVREARFQAIRAARAQASQQMIVQTSVLASEPTAARNDQPLPLATFRRGLARATSESMADDYVLLEGWATSFALRFARSLAIANVIDLETLVSTGRVPREARRWLDDLLLALERSGLSRRDRMGRHIDPDIALPDPGDILQTIAQEHQSLTAELLIASAAHVAVDAILATNEGAPPRPIPAKVLDGFELGSAHVQACACRLDALVRASVAAWPSDRSLRILQVGCGPLTTHMVALAEETRATLTILDLDRRRLERARTTFADRGDIAFIDQLDDLPEARFDLLVSVHTLHRHRRTLGFLPALRRAMAPGAIFAAIEPTPSFFRDFVLGLDAWLAREDRDFDGLSIGETDWLDALQGLGFQDAHVEPVDTTGGVALALTADVASERRHRSGAGTAVIVGDDRAVDTEATTALATLLASSGVHVSIVPDAELGEGTIAETSMVILPLSGRYDPGVAPAKRLHDQCLRLKRLADRLGQSRTRVWLVMMGAISGTNDYEADVAAGVWAFSRTLANEVPTLDIRRLDIAEDLRSDELALRLRDIVLSDTNETEIVLEKRATRVVRFEPTSSPRLESEEQAEAARLMRGEGAGIDRLRWDAIRRQAPGTGEIEIAVEAIGLNFRDVMFGLGLLPEDILEHGFAGPTLGLECAGRIERLGPGVKGLRRGDRVMAFAKSAFSTHVTTPAALAAPVPEALSIEAAATIPVAFLTAYYALMICARLKPNEWVLIHGGAGGVGMAALQIARWRGARVIATAGSPEKRSLLLALGADHVFDSRSGAFVDDIRQVTGEGVAVVLNSLSGEAMERSISILKPFGRFVELGKRDYVANTHIGLRPFRRNLSYFGVDLDQLLIDEPATSRGLMRSVMRLFASGELVALPYRTFDAADTIEAFRHMQQSAHVGKLVLRPPPLSAVKMHHKRPWRASAEKMHLVTGGLGGFGLETARWLAAKGARNLLLLGRSGAATEEAKGQIDALVAQDVRVRVEAIDVADRTAMRALFARFGRDLPMLGGIVHAAMVLDDSLLANLTAEKLERVLRPKVAGAALLDELSRDMALDYFVLYSSVTTLIGNPGQAAYVAANGYLEGLARRRRRSGLPALAVAWGAIEDVGVLARSDATREMLAKRAGVKGLAAQDALGQLGEVLAKPSSDPESAVVTIASINWSAARQHLPILHSPAYRKLTSRDETIANEKEKIDIAALVAGHTPDEARKMIGGFIVDEIANVLRLPREDIVRTAPLSELGLDSLMAVELALGLEERFTLNAPLSTTASGFTVNELADHIAGLASGAAVQDDEALARTMIDRHLGAQGEDDATRHRPEDLGIGKDRDRTITRLLN